MPLRNKKQQVGIIIVAFNCPDFIMRQVECINRFYQGECDIIIFDNSNVIRCDISKMEVFRDRFEHANKNNVLYHGFVGQYNNPSDSHSYACNEAYKFYSSQYSRLLFLDHDIFPVKPFSIDNLLFANNTSYYVISGLGQIKNHYIYYWAGCVAFNTNLVHPDIVDFSTNSELGLDTGGNLYRCIEGYGPLCGFVNEERLQNPYFNSSEYDFYTLVNKGMFMHFTNGSNWNKSAKNDDRISSLYRILTERINSQQ